MTGLRLIIISKVFKNTKMSIKHILFLITTAFFVFACGQNAGNSSKKDSKSQIEEQGKTWAEVMAIHDEVMPKMGRVAKVNDKMKHQLSTNRDLDKTLKKDMLSAVVNLDRVEQKMWDWMHELKQLGPLRDSLEHNAIMTYLKNEKFKIDQVKTSMLNSLKTCESFLEKLEETQ